ncbi:hypothetical protein [Leptolyngbya sp. CCY15150]|uniref:hypothetical protein n=1 Tax=Leptolyngbya sp. CCY15150 TaxID=2767772 RepID=UPI00194FAF4F|nr:hypothetical protein [Leptolyngbya sp. CCY15150]
MYTKKIDLRESDIVNLRQDTGIDSLNLNESFLEMIERGVVEKLIKDKQEYRIQYAAALRKNGSLNQRDRTKLLALQAEKGLGNVIIQTITAEEDQAFEHDQHLYRQACADYFHQTAASIDEANQYLQPQAKSFQFGRAVVNAILEQEQEYFEKNRQSYRSQAKEQLFGHGRFNQALLTKQQAELKLGDRVVQSIEDEVSHTFQDIRHAYADLYKADLYDDEAVERAHLRDHQRDFPLGDEVVIQVHQDIQDEFQRDRQTYYDADFADLHDDGQRDIERLKVLQRQLGLGDIVIQSVQVNVDQQFREHWSDYKNAYQIDLYEDGHCNQEVLRARQLKLHLGYEVIKAIAQTVAEDFDSDRQRYGQRAADQLHSSGTFNEGELSSLQQELGLGETVCQDLEDKAQTAFNEDCETFKAEVFEHLHQWGEVQDHQLLELQLGLGKAVKDSIIQEESDRFQSEVTILAEVIAQQLHQHDTWQSDQLTQMQAEFQLSDSIVEHIVAEQQDIYHSHRRTYRLVYSQATREITGSTLSADAAVRLAQLRDELGLSGKVSHGIKQAYHYAQLQYQNTFDSVLRRYDCSNNQTLSIDASDRSSLHELQTSLDLEAEDIQMIERDAEQDYRHSLDDYEEEVRSLLRDNAELVDSDMATLKQLQQELYIQPNVADCIKSRVLDDLGLQVEAPVMSPVISQEDLSSLQQDLGLGETVGQDLKDRANIAFNKELKAASEKVTYIVLLNSSKTIVSIGEELEIAIKLQDFRDVSEHNHLIEIPSNEIAGNEINILLNATGFQVKGDSVASFPLGLHMATQQISQTASFRLVALRPGTSTITAELYQGDTFTTTLEATVQVIGLEESTFLNTSIKAEPRPVSQPDLVLQVQTLWNETASVCTFRYHLRSFRASSLLTPGISYQSQPLSASWLEQVHELLQTELETLSDTLPTDGRSHLTSLGQYLFQHLFPSELQTDLRNLNRYQALTLLILADQDAQFPWTLLHNGQEFLGERFIIGHWLWDLNNAHPYEFPVGAINIAHYANVEQPEVWATLLEPPGAPPPLILTGGVLDDLATTEAMRGLHLIRMGQSTADADRQDAPVPLDIAVAEVDIDQKIRPIKLSLRRNHPLITLSYLRQDQPELTHLQQTWAATFIRAGCSAFVGSLWAVNPATEAAFVSSFYHALWKGDSLGGAFQTARRLARAAVPDSLDWLAYLLFGDPMARPYRPVQGQGYAVVEPIGQDINDPVPPGSTIRFKVSLRRTPPVWHEERVIEVAENLTFGDLQASISASGLEVMPSASIPLRILPNGNYLGWFNLAVPTDITEESALIQVYFVDGRRLVQSLTFALNINYGGNC